MAAYKENLFQWGIEGAVYGSFSGKMVDFHGSVILNKCPLNWPCCNI